MPNVVRDSDLLDEHVNARAIATVLVGLAIGVVFWSALFLIVT